MATVLNFDRFALASRPAVALFFGVLICWTLGLANQGGGIRGQIVDPGLETLPNATIRMMPRTTRSTKYRSQGRSNGSFHHGELKVPLECTADVDHGQVLCTGVLDGPAPAAPISDRTSDFWLHLKTDKHVYFKARKGAQLAEPNSTEKAESLGAVFLDRPIRVDGFGPGSDLCLRSNDGRISHIFFTAEVKPDSKQISAHYVTLKYGAPLAFHCRTKPPRFPKVAALGFGERATAQSSMTHVKVPWTLCSSTDY